MPIYAYRCTSCGFEKDHLQKIDDPPLEVCPECAQPSYRKQVTAAGFQLKGTGWYATDFRDGGRKAKVADDKPTAADNPPAADKPATSPPAAKSEAPGGANACADS
ncbi:FmdB family zinc ribbon protein [Accumulibacter sp.]|uniref:FmdB family zinc ribbon protein n=1 Tax=Accumulibacter sp. TaxID=2053492 RepID=UPI0025FD38AF|nr:FmdB family zinc ribbon protein [Accumulibacter sp.]MCM8594760.1 zinc ribbon domain-containing protein [Accumulibacter sp.]MCM8625823.1 zinc ribbon domain-containing protein [Accumulibacter sp.]MDS4048906.1 FmdB family zinc ribbon protein [Accumulibacter sp.]